MPDYCTSWPDRLFGKDWSHCCLAHDVAYSLPGSQFEDDIELMRCVAEATGWWPLAAAMFLGVVLFGKRYRKRARKT